MKQYFIQAQHLATRLVLKIVAGLIKESPIVQTPYELVYEMRANSYIFIYNFGAIVFFNIEEDLRNRFLQDIVGNKRKNVHATSEDFVIEEVAGGNSQLGGNLHELSFNKVRIVDLSFEKIKLICSVIAESTAIEYFELIVERDLLTQTQTISRNLKTSGDTDLSMIEMSKFIGMCLSTKQEIITEFYVVDSPEETWEDQTLSRLYVDVKQLFEIETRYKVLEYKLKLVQETVAVVVEMLRFKKQSFFEMIIIALIAVEVIWLVLKIFFPHLAPS